MYAKYVRHTRMYAYGFLKELTLFCMCVERKHVFCMCFERKHVFCMCVERKHVFCMCVERKHVFCKVLDYFFACRRLRDFSIKFYL